MNYDDARWVAADRGDWFVRIDKRAMKAEFVAENDDGEETVYEVPIKYAVCDLCDGQGRHVNPAIDDNGITGSEWDEWDQDDRENYLGGAYDVSCYQCKGLRVTPEPDRTAASAEVISALDVLDKKLQDDADYDALCRAERRMGC